jgi:cytoskeleton protein RodZ
MGAIGDRLREARMRRKLDIADVEERTKIRAKYLRALENEEFGLLPGATFVKTFLRTYAEELGLDPHVLLEEYRASYEPRDEAEVTPLGPPAASRRGRERLPRYGAPRYGGGPPTRGVLFAGIVVAVLAFLLVLGLVSGGDDEGSQSASTTTNTERQQQQPRKKRKKRRAAPVPTRVKLRIEPQFPTYACIDTGEGTDIVYQGILQKAQTFRGKHLRVNLGKSSARMIVNGKPLNVEPTPNPVGYDFTPRKSTPIPSGQRPCQGV